LRRQWGTAHARQGSREAFHVLKPIQFWVLSSLAAVALMLTVVNAALFYFDLGARSRVNARGEYLGQTQSIATVYQQMAQSLANLAVSNHDERLQSMLVNEGFKINANPAPAPDTTRAGKP